MPQTIAVASEIMKEKVQENAIGEGHRSLGRLKSENYTIEMREFMVKSYFLKFAHNFWVLYDNKGDIVSEIHGLKTDRKTNKPTHKGWWGNRIQVWVYPLDKQSPKKPDDYGFSGLYRLDQPARKYLVSPKEEIYMHWNKALNASAKITKMDIDYWALLFACKGGNSNSVARTLADTMGFRYSPLHYSDPGSEKNLLTGKCGKVKSVLPTAGEGEKDHAHMSETSERPFERDQVNAQPMLFQVILNEGGKLYGWLQDFFVNKAHQILFSQRTPKLAFVTAEQKAIWEKSFVGLDSINPAQLAKHNNNITRADMPRFQVTNQSFFNAVTQQSTDSTLAPATNNSMSISANRV